MKKTIINSDQSRDSYIDLVRFMYDKYHYLEVACSKATRTARQNRAFHQYFRLLSEELNEKGLDIRKTLRQDVDIPWNPDAVKEFIWRPVMEAETGKKSTTKLTRAEVGQVYDIIHRYMIDKFEVFVPFPQNHENDV